jgi:DNA invertase Pin-like site-specific DNA recombinase
VSGPDPVEARPGFAALLAHIAGNGVRMIVVETANRFARDLVVQEVGFAMLRDLGVRLMAADSPSSFLDDGPTSKLIRQILGAVSEFHKAMIVAKLKGARERARRAQSKCEGRKAYTEREGGQDLVAAARQLRDNPSGRHRSLRKIAATERGYVTPSGRPYSASAIASMLRDKKPPARSVPLFVCFLRRHVDRSRVLSDPLLLGHRPVTDDALAERVIGLLGVAPARGRGSSARRSAP